MIFTIDRDIFLENLNIISRGLPGKTSNPILTGIKLEVTTNDIYMVSTNMDISVQVLINDKSLEIEEPGKVVIPGKEFINAIRSANNKKIKISLNDGNTILINYGRGEFNLKVLEANDYPAIKFVTEENPLTIPSDYIKSIIKETCFATSTSEKKPVLTGVNFNYSNENKVLKCIATDAFRLACKNINLNQDYNDFNLTIPNKSLDELLKIIDKFNGDLNVYFAANKILFRYGNVIFQTRLLDGNYPDTSRIIPTEFKTKIGFNKDELIEAVERVSLFSPRDKEKDREVTYSIINLKINKNKNIEISTTNSQVGDAKEELIASSLEFDEPLNVGFSSKYLLDALRAFDSVEVVINFIDANKPFIITNENNNSLIQLILPVRMN